jgi:uncharacterized protein (AIM24 family)
LARSDAGDDAIEGLDEEFLHHLARGADQLAAGDAEAARQSLRRAHEMRPRDGKVLGLLGQACYRAGLFDEAVQAYAALVDDAPTEVPPRVNLGLALIKARRHPEAIRHLAIVMDLNPDHKKAMGYLGLAHLESGDPAAARGWFERAGSLNMVARCDELLARGGVAREPAPEPALSLPVEAAEPPPRPAPIEIHTPVRVEIPAPALAPSAVVPPEPAETPVAPAAAVEVPVPESPTAPPVPEPSIEVTVSPLAAAPGPITASFAIETVEAEPSPATAGEGQVPFAAQRTLRPARDVFAVEGNVLHVAVRGEVLARLEGLFAARGAVTLKPEVKRFRGKSTDKPFGAGRDRLHRFSGEGALFYRTGGWVYTVVDLAGESGYFREESVFALEEPLAYENGRVPSRHSRDLDLVHLRGQGRFLLRSAVAPLALETTTSSPLRVPLSSLLGWTGSVTPQIEVLGAMGLVEGPGLVVAQLTGEGRVLVDPDAGIGE